MQGAVKAWTERVSIPTYAIGPEQKLPLFLEKRVYQGSSGAVYPYPVVESIADEPVPQDWTACWLENDFIRIMILPELGGRVQMAYDKLKQRHFIYHNRVIKPALVGLTGPWISGGIEFNWPQHHRPSTYLPVDFRIESHEDGSQTVWCSEIERMFHTKGMAGFRLYPDKAYLEINVQLYNRTPLPQTFLWWANPAVSVDDHYQSVFPPDVNAVYDHGKRDVSTFPIATGTYYKVDYSAGVDISRYKNIPVPTSYMAVASAYDFLGGYEHDTVAGMLHVANHHIAPGKKQWTWGHGDFGRAWDRNLTDEDGPYIELMCGVFTDNQPDFSWLAPYEEKSFTQYFMPYRDIGVVKNASKEAMVNLEFAGEEALIKVYATGIYPVATIRLETEDRRWFEEVCDLHPAMSIRKKVAIDATLPAHAYRLSVQSAEGRVLVEWRPEHERDQPVPEPAKAADLPANIEQIEQLYLTGLHLEQYRHATYRPEDYYREALRRDPGDLRCNNALGRLLLRRGQFKLAEEHLRRAAATIMARNPNPYDGEPLYNLGLSLLLQEKTDEAFTWFYKSTWNAALTDAGYFQVARIHASRQQWSEAHVALKRCLQRNTQHHQARHLSIACLRHLEQSDQALREIEVALEADRFNTGAIYERYLLERRESDAVLLVGLMRDNIHHYLEIALDYAWAGLYAEAIELIELGESQRGRAYPMSWYYIGWMLARQGNSEQARAAMVRAEQCDPDYCFPNRMEAVSALTTAMEFNPKGARAPYYLGNFWYAHKQYSEARSCWERSLEADDSNPIAWRNLALACNNKFSEPDKARKAMERAWQLDASNARLLMELDLLRKKQKVLPEHRLATLEQYTSLLQQRDDLYLERITLLNMLGRHDDALQLLLNHRFHPWEGGEGKVSGQYVLALSQLAIKDLEQGKYELALQKLEAASHYPESLGEGKLASLSTSDLDFWKGFVLDALGDKQQARSAWQRATRGSDDLAMAWFYNDVPPDHLLYKGLSLIRLGHEEEGYRLFDRLIAHGREHLHDEISIDYFAVSLPDMLIWEEDLQSRNYIHCTYLMALGHLGLGQFRQAQKCFEEVLHQDPSHTGALLHLRLFDILDKVKVV